jgi:hypothetical protein
MDLSLLSTLKDKLMHASEFADTMGYSFDHFVDDAGFFEFGRKSTEERLRLLVEAVGQSIIPGAKLDAFFPIRWDEQKFIHAGGKLAGRVLTMFYFEDIDMGLIAVHMTSDMVQFARITTKELPADFELRN